MSFYPEEIPYAAAMGSAIPFAMKLIEAGHIGSFLAGIASFVPVILEDIPPNRLETALRSIEEREAGEPEEVLADRRAFVAWVRLAMDSARKHGIK